MNWVDAVMHGILLGGLYALFACGLSVLFGVMRVVNLAHGDWAILAAYLALIIGPALHLEGFSSLLVVVPVLALIGYAVQRVVIQRTLRAGPLTSLLATFGIAIVIQNALLEWRSANSQTLTTGRLASESLSIGRLNLAYIDLIIFGLAVAVLVGLQLFLSRTNWGRLIRATADDPEAVQVVGGNSEHVYAVASAIAFASVAVAGVAFGMSGQFGPATGATWLLFAFEAVIIGGLGSLWGTLLGGMVLGIAQTVGAEYDPSASILAGHLLFLAVLAFRPQGLIPARTV